MEVLAPDSRADGSAKDRLLRISASNVEAPTEPKAIDFTGQDLSGLDLSRRNLTNYVFRLCIMHETNFYGAVLRGADFRDADLNGADMRRCDAEGASFAFGCLRNVNLSHANLSYASLVNVYWSIQPGSAVKEKPAKGSLWIWPDPYEGGTQARRPLKWERATVDVEVAHLLHSAAVVQ
jgi:hypothetical protein